MDNFKSFQNLFNHVKTILEIKQKTNHNRCNDFTVFTALRNETDEKKTHTTFLYEILRPNGTHGMGDAFLKDFFSTVLKIDNYDSSARIYKEFDYNLSDDNCGRIDLLIETSSARYPIEIKIYAGDQERQVSRYNEFAKTKKKSDISKVYYLTLNGYLPSEKSLDNLDAEDVICVSFAKEIYTWLNNCVVVANQNHAQDVAVAIQQYQTLLNKLTDGQQDDAYMDAIKKTISASRENYECAAAIERSLVSVRTEKFKKLFKDISCYLRNNKLIKKHLSENVHPEYTSSLYNEDIESRIENYYPSGKNTWPRLRIEIKRKDNIRVFLEIEVDTTLYYGVTVLDKDMNEITSQNLKKGVRDIFDNPNWKAYAVEFCKKSKRWIWWECLPEQDNPLILRECTGLYKNMYDDEGYKDILNEITKKLGDNLKRILETGCARE